MFVKNELPCGGKNRLFIIIKAFAPECHPQIALSEVGATELLFEHLPMASIDCYRVSIKCLLLALCALIMGGCGQAGPIVVGPHHLGLGWYRDGGGCRAQTLDSVPETVEQLNIEGFGILFAASRISLGYSRLFMVVAPPNADFDLQLSSLRVAAGSHADRLAQDALCLSPDSSTANQD